MPVIVCPKTIHMFDTFEGVRNGMTHWNVHHHFEHMGHHFIWEKKGQYEWLEDAVRSHVDNAVDLNDLAYRLHNFFIANHITVHYCLISFTDRVDSINSDEGVTYWQRNYEVEHYYINSKEKQPVKCCYTNNDLLDFSATYGIDDAQKKYMKYAYARLMDISTDAEEWGEPTMDRIIMREIEWKLIRGEHRRIDITVLESKRFVLVTGVRPETQPCIEFL